MTFPPPATRLPGAARFLTVTEVASMMRVSKMSIYRLIHGGDLRALRIGRSFRVLPRDLADYLRHANTIEWERPGGAA